MAPSPEKSVPSSNEDDAQALEDPYSLSFRRSSKRLKKAVDLIPTVTSPSKEQKEEESKSAGEVPLVGTTDKVVGKGNSVSPAGD